MPEALTERAMALARGGEGWSAPPTRDAATVVLCRDAADGAGLEVFLLRRVRSMAFAAGMHVFPGGAVDPADSAADIPWHPGAAPDPDRVSASPDLARALVVAAVRETFEECGVLLAVDADGHPAALDDAVTAERDRVEVLEGRATMATVLRRRGLAVDPALLPVWDHWVTPEVEGRRYDTRFFAAALPGGQRALDVGGEADRTLWITPGAALTASAEGSMAMLPPTSATLAALRPLDSTAALLEAAPLREVRPIMPRPFLDDGVLRWRLVDARDGSVVRSW
jgi:8-oxo-dGTP pyrophosphatase MutT (NUDIX family)